MAVGENALRYIIVELSVTLADSHTYDTGRETLISRSGVLLTTRRYVESLIWQAGFPSSRYARQLVYYLFNLRHELRGDCTGCGNHLCDTHETAGVDVADCFRRK